jgi:hypothetical protein
MGKLSFVLLFLLSIFIISCSSNGQNPVTPSDPSDDITPMPQSDNEGVKHQLLGSWTVDFDIKNLTATLSQDRTLNQHYNVTTIIPAPVITVNSFDPVSETVDVDVMIYNPYLKDVYDVRLILYTDVAGHMLLNDDNWTALYDMPDGLPANPFKAYAKYAQNRKFGGTERHSENLQIKCPGNNYSVQFAIDASYPGNCTEPYLMENFTQETFYDIQNSPAEVSIQVYDWQDDVNRVELMCSGISGVDIVSLVHDSGAIWKADIINLTGASAGEYQGYIAAYSSGSGNLALYEPVLITVTENHFCNGEDEIEPNNDCMRASIAVQNVEAHGCVQEDVDSIDQWSVEIYQNGIYEIYVKNRSAGDVDFGYTNEDCSQWYGGSGTHGAGQDEWVSGISLNAGIYKIHVVSDNDSGPYAPPRNYGFLVTRIDVDTGSPVWDSTIGIKSVLEGSERVTVSWGKATDRLTPPVSYLLYIDQDSDPWDTTPVIRTETNPYTFTGLTGGQTYWFGVRCQDSYNPPNIDTNTVVLSATPGDVTPPDWTSTVGITNTLQGNEKVTVYWGTATDRFNQPVEYLLYADDDNDPWDQVPVIRSNNNPYTFTGLTDGQTYWFGVRCRDSHVPPNVDTNNVVMSSIPGYDIFPPVWDSTIGITDTYPDDSQVTIYWGTATDEMSPPVEYLLYIDQDNYPWDQVPIIRSTNDPYTFPGLINGTTYWFGVRTRDSNTPPNVEMNEVVKSEKPNPLLLREVGSINSGARAIDFNENIACFALGDHVSIYDVSDVSSPDQVGSIPACATDLAMEGFYACLVCPTMNLTTGALVIYDVSDSSSPQEVSHMSFGAPPDNIEIINHYCYVNPITMNEYWEKVGSVHQIDLTDPYNPVIVDGVDCADTLQSDNAGYLSTVLYRFDPEHPQYDRAEIAVWDGHNPPGFPQKFSDELVHYGNNFGARESGNGYFYYFRTEDGITEFRVVDLSSGQIIARPQLHPTGYMKSIEDMLFFSRGNRVEIYDVSDPTNPSLISTQNTGIPVELINYHNGYVYITGGSETKIFEFL